MTPDERAAKIVLMIRTENTSALAHSQIQEVAAQIGAAVEEATTKDRSEIEDLIWNLAGCSTFALGYGLDEPFDKSKARAAIFDVHALALRYRKAKAEAYEDAAKIADEGTRKDSGQDIALRIRARAAEVGK